MTMMKFIRWTHFGSIIVETIRGTVLRQLCLGQLGPWTVGCQIVSPLDNQVGPTVRCPSRARAPGSNCPGPTALEPEELPAPETHWKPCQFVRKLNKRNLEKDSFKNPYTWETGRPHSSFIFSWIFSIFSNSARAEADPKNCSIFFCNLLLVVFLQKAS